MLLLDEPTNHLDLESKSALEKALEAYPGTVLFVSHDRYFVDRIATKVWEFNLSRVTEYEGNYSAYREEKARLAVAQEELKPSKAPRPSRRPRQNAKKAAEQILLLEKEIQRLEEEKAALEVTLSDPETYKTPQVTQVTTEYQALLDDLDKLYTQWEKISE